MTSYIFSKAKLEINIQQLGFCKIKVSEKGKIKVIEVKITV